MSAPLTTAQSFNVTYAGIIPVGATKMKEITNMILRFDYLESIDQPLVEGKLKLVDTGENLISSLPLQGFETVKIKVETTNGEMEYELKVYKIFDRFAFDRYQEYTLGLVPLTALKNESVKVPLTLSGTPTAVVNKLLTEFLEVPSTKLQLEASSNKIKFCPGKKTPFAIIKSIQSKTLSQSAKNAPSPPVTDSSTTTSSTGDSTVGNLVGSSGYFFYENKEGYNFQSIDKLNSLKKNPPIAIYTQENAQVGGDTRNKILDIDFDSEIDMLAKLRTGAFSSVIAYYNYSTGAYEEYCFSLKKNFNHMEHLGSQSGLPSGQSELSTAPTRIMSVLIDHETWFDGKEIASTEQKDGGKKTTAEFPDYQKYYTAQSISREYSLNNQQVRLTVPVNPNLMVGKTIEIRIPHQVPTKHRLANMYDPEHSGVYLIATVDHAYAPKNAQAFSFLTLIRDSYGRPGEGSKVQVNVTK
jgi:hypothetical protein